MGGENWGDTGTRLEGRGGYATGCELRFKTEGGWVKRGGWGGCEEWLRSVREEGGKKEKKGKGREDGREGGTRQPGWIFMSGVDGLIETRASELDQEWDEHR